ncbi:MAG TPA: L-lactate permease [Nocardioidaceae bacterium]|nr:L-lactate permease [Nocardioidaceae bacterium]
MTPAVTPWSWLAAAAPVLVLLALVTTGRMKTRTAALLVAGLTLLLAWTVFGSGALTLGVALAKGLWLGTWILYVVFPAMLLYRIAERAGFDRIGSLFGHLFPNRSENLLVLAWLLPSFVQGVAGFGTPIAVAAPLLAASGWARHRAVAYPLIGYHWSVTFGSMGSSYYMAALTAHLTGHESTAFAHRASLLLGVNCLVAGALLLLLDGGLRGLRDGGPLLLVAGVPMAVTLYAVTAVVPAVGSVAAGAVGFAAAITLAVVTRRVRRRRVTATEETIPGHESRSRAVWLVSPYLYLLGIALLVLLVPASRHWVDRQAALAPGFPGTSTALGWRTPAISGYTPLRLFDHPGTYLLLACGLGYLTYRAVGLWQRRPVAEMARAWWSSVHSTAVSILALACVTTVLIEAGMVSTLARGAVAATGPAFPALSGLIGALGSFLTGSSTSSNALFSALQADVAGLLHAPASVLLAAQTAGANVGNSLAPVVVLIGVSAVGGGVETHRVLRVVAVAAVVLLAVVTGLTLVMFRWAT